MNTCVDSAALHQQQNETKTKGNIQMKIFIYIKLAYEVKNNLCLFERPFKENKNDIFFWNIFSRSRDIQDFVQKLMSQIVSVQN